MEAAVSIKDVTRWNKLKKNCKHYFSSQMKTDNKIFVILHMDLSLRMNKHIYLLRFDCFHYK